MCAYQLLEHRGATVVVVPEAGHFVRLRELGIPVIMVPPLEIYKGNVQAEELIAERIAAMTSKRDALLVQQGLPVPKQSIKLCLLTKPLWHEPGIHEPFSKALFQRFAEALRRILQQRSRWTCATPSFRLIASDRVHQQTRGTGDELRKFLGIELITSESSPPARTRRRKDRATADHPWPELRVECRGTDPSANSAGFAEPARLSSRVRYL